MKNIVLIIFSFFVLQGALAQSETHLIATVNSSERFDADKINNQFSFVLPSEITADDVKHQATYYTDYFKVKFDEKHHALTVIMNSRDEVNKKVMRRLFAGLQIEQMEYDGEIFSMDDFFRKKILPIDRNLIKK